MGCAYRLTIVAALGEVRHLRKRKRRRETIYENIWNHTDTPLARRMFLKAIAKFAQYDLWGHNYGGRKWEEFSLLAVDLYHALIDSNAHTALESLNLIVNAAHNGGWAFNKFASESTLNVAAESPVQMVVACAPQLYESPRYAITTWKRRKLVIPPTASEIPPTKEVIDAQIFVEGNKGHVQYKLKGQMAKTYHSLDVVLEDTSAKWRDIKYGQIANSFAGSEKSYVKLRKIGSDWFYHSQLIMKGEN
jgi:hypothetical protein